MGELHRTNYFSDSRSESRHVLLHYHTFKNAGTSVDAILSNCFGDEFMSVDGPVPEFFINQTEVNVMIRIRAQVKAFSSHQIRLPVPLDPRIEYLPIIFIRRPELRVQSMWRFQRSRADSHPATKLAKELDFREWIRFHLDERRHASLLNQQTRLFSFQYDQRTPVNHPEILDLAIDNIQALPFVGIVEHFEASMNIYRRLFQHLVPELVFETLPQLNRSSQGYQPVREEMARIERELGSGLFAELTERMHQDLELYERCCSAFDRQKRNLLDEAT